MIAVKFIDMFGGIGGFRHGIQNVIPDAECAAYYEKDEFAVDSYNAIFGENHEPTDVTELEPREVPDHSIICGGFPCQAFSMAGKRRGFADPRGTLFSEILRIAEAKGTPYLFLENVRGLLSHDGGRTFGTILKSLHDAGYDAQWEVLNSKNFGVPQNRERLFIIAHLRSEPRPEVFPFGRENKENPGTDGIEVVGNTNPSGRGMNGKVYAARGIAPTVSTNKGEGHKIIQIGRGYNDGGSHDIAPTVSSNSYEENNFLQEKCEWRTALYHSRGFETKDEPISHTVKGGGGGTSKNFATDGHRIRKLTPRECWRLQGFPDEVFVKASDVNSDTQLYKQAGNAVTVNVVEAIMAAWKPYLVNDETNEQAVALTA